MVWNAMGHDGQENIVVEHTENEWGIEVCGANEEVSEISFSTGNVAYNSVLYTRNTKLICYAIL